MRYFGVIAVLFAGCLFVACDQPTDSKKADESAEPPVMVEEEVTEETVVEPDASAGAHQGEPPSANQPQPVYPDGGGSDQ